MFLLKLLSRHDGCHRQEDNLEVVPKGAVGQIVEIHAQALEHLFHRIGITVVEGGGREDSRAHQVDVPVVGVLLHNLFGKVGAFGAGAYE